MKTVRDGCQLQPNALSVKLSDQIEQLDELISAEGNGTAFFDRTFITQGMKDLITEGKGRDMPAPVSPVNIRVRRRGSGS